jgi:hypothetical protein
MLTQIHAAHAARAEPFQDLVLADGEAPPLPLHDLFGLEVRQQAVAHQLVGQRGGRARQLAGGAWLVQIRIQALFVQYATFAHQLQKLLIGGWRRH